MVALGALAGGGFLAYRVISARKPVLTTLEEPPKAEPPADPLPKPPKGTPKPVAQAVIPSPPVQTAPGPEPAVQNPTTPPSKPQPRSSLPPPIITEDPPEPKPVPEPPSVQGLPPQQQKNTANVSLSEAIRLADSDPPRAIEGLRKAIAADPGNPNAYAWLAVVLYEQGRYPEIPGVLAKARQNGIPRARLLSNMRFKMIVQNDRLNHRIPGGTGGDE
jgi:hypothetical protein